MTRFVALVVAALLALVSRPTPALAAGPLELSARVSQQEVEVGEPFTVRLEATSEEGGATDPELVAPRGARVQGPSVGTTHSISFGGGSRSSRVGLTATWSVEMGAPGTATFLARVRYEGRRHESRVTVKIVPRGSTPRRPAPRGAPNPFDPFAGVDPFGGTDPFRRLAPFASPFDDEPEPPRAPAQGTDPRLALPVPRGRTAFLHAVLDKSRAVVGEQVTLTVYLYVDERADSLKFFDVHEADAPDFVKRSLLADDSKANHVGFAEVGGRIYSVNLVRKSALFPLKAGELAITPMRLTIVDSRKEKLARTSEALTVTAVDAPLSGRPAGFRSGDVGAFRLAADVSPRTVPLGGAIGVTVTLSGTGNLPSTLPLPHRAGVRWLEPEVRDAVTPGDSGVYGGSRTFTYVVRLDSAGRVDLGDLSLPFYDASAQAYRTARVELGAIEVTPGVAAASATTDAGTPAALGALPAARQALEGPKAELLPWSDRHGLLWGVGALPVATLAIMTSARRARVLLAWRRARGASPKVTVAKLLGDAEASLRQGDGDATVRALQRALETSVEHACGVNLRGTAGDARLGELRGAGIEPARASDVVALLERCEAVRYAPEPTPTEDASALLEQGRLLMATLGKVGPQ